MEIREQRAGLGSPLPWVPGIRFTPPGLVGSVFMHQINMAPNRNSFGHNIINILLT